jgi:hypothetical protein
VFAVEHSLDGGAKHENLHLEAFVLIIEHRGVADIELDLLGEPLSTFQ